MFVQIHEGFAAVRAALTPRPRRMPPTRYTRKARPSTLSTTPPRRYSRPAGHRAHGLTRPSYSHPAYRARHIGRFIAIAAVARAERRPRRTRSTVTAAPRARESAPARSQIPDSRNADRLAIIHRWARESIRDRARHGIGTIKRHAANPRWKSRDAIHLPYIGLCWDTAEQPKVTTS